MSGFQGVGDINKVRDAFQPRTESTLGLVSKEELDDLTQDVALYWMYFLHHKPAPR
jgi:hypothetical protein